MLDGTDGNVVDVTLRTTHTERCPGNNIYYFVRKTIENMVKLCIPSSALFLPKFYFTPTFADAGVKRKSIEH